MSNVRSGVLPRLISIRILLLLVCIKQNQGLNSGLEVCLHVNGNEMLIYAWGFCIILELIDVIAGSLQVTCLLSTT